MRIAVLMATHNGSEFIDDQLKTILNSSDVNLTIFVSDDGSTDDTVEIVSRYLACNVVLLKPTKAGSAGQNFFRMIRDLPDYEFDYFAFADQDDLWHPDKLSRAVKMLKSTLTAGYSSDVEAFFPGGKKQLIKKSYPQKEWDFLFESAGPGNTIVLPQQSFLLLRNFLNSADRDVLDRVTFHDWFIYAFIRGQHLGWHIDNFVSVEYRQHNRNVIGASVGRKAIFLRLRKVFSGWYLEQSQILYYLCCESPSRIERLLLPSAKNIYRYPQLLFQCRRRTIDSVFFATFLTLIGVAADIKSIYRRVLSQILRRI